MRNNQRTGARFRRLLCVLFGGLLLISAAIGGDHAAAQGLSGIPGAFIDIGPDASAAGRGLTGVASASGASALSWNVAGVVHSRDMEAAFAYVDQLESVQFEHAAISIPVRRLGSALALSVTASGDDMLRELTARAGWALATGPVSFGIAGIYRRATFGRNTLDPGDYQVFEPDEIADGASRQVRGEASGIGMEAGFRARLGDRVDAGIAVKNIWAPVEWRRSSSIAHRAYRESVPAEVLVGVMLRPARSLDIAFDVSPAVYSDAYDRYSVGLELRPVSLVALRAGRIHISDGARNEVTSFGMGIRFADLLGVRLEADVAYLTSSLASSRQVSLVIGL